MNCIIDQCYVCQSLVKFPTYTFPYVVSSPTIRLAYDLFLFISFLLLQQESKEGKTQTKLYYISRTQLQGLITKQTHKKKGSNETFIHLIAKDNHGSN